MPKGYPGRFVPSGALQISESRIGSWTSDLGPYQNHSWFWRPPHRGATAADAPCPIVGGHPGRTQVLPLRSNGIPPSGAKTGAAPLPGGGSSFFIKRISGRALHSTWKRLVVRQGSDLLSLCGRNRAALPMEFHGNMARPLVGGLRPNYFEEEISTPPEPSAMLITRTSFLKASSICAPQRHSPMRPKATAFDPWKLVRRT